MVPAVVLALALAASAVSLPVTPEEFVSTGAQGTPVIQTNGKIVGVSPISQEVEKTGYQGSQQVLPETQVSDHVGTHVGQHYPGEQVETVPVTKTQGEPAGYEQTQQPYGEQPVLLPVQPLSVVPVGQVGQVLRPIVVPAEAITAGRIIIMAVEPIGQRVFQQDAATTPERQTTYQQEYATGQTQVAEPHQQQYNVQQEVPVKTGTPVTGYTQTSEGQQVEPHRQTIVQTPTQGLRTVVAENVEQQTIQQSNYNYVPVQGQAVEPSQQQQQQQQQQQYQQVPVTDYAPIRTQTVEQQTYGHQPTETVEKHVTQQQTVPAEQVQQQQVYNVHPVSTGRQAITVPEPVSVQNQQVEPVLAENVQQQQQPYYVRPVVPQQQQYNVQPTVEKGTPYQQSVQAQSVRPVPHQQAFSVVPPQVPYQQSVEHVPVRPQSAEPVQKQTSQIQPSGGSFVEQISQQQPIEQQTNIQEQLSRISDVTYNEEQLEGQPIVTDTFGLKIPQLESPQQGAAVQTHHQEPSAASPRG